MGVFGGIASGGLDFSLGRALWKSRVPLAVGIGAGVGAATTDRESDTGIFKAALTGGMMGGLLGLGSTKMAMKGMWGATKATAKGLPIALGQAAMGTAKFAGRHPFLATGMTIGGIAMGASYATSQEQQQPPIEGPSTGTISNNLLTNSTIGLTNGLHRNRHG